METSDDKNHTAWLNDRLKALIDPAVAQPKEDRVLERLQIRSRQRTSKRRTLLVASVSLLLVVLLLAALPAGRLIAQRVWQRLTGTGIAVVRVNEDRSMFEGGFIHWQTIQPAEPAQQVDNIDEAAKLAGFVPRLPDWTVLGDRPRNIDLFVLGVSGARMTLDAAGLRDALRKKGIRDVTIPQSWDGTEFVSEFGPTVFAGFDRQILLRQSPPSPLKVPPDFPYAELMALFDRMSDMPAAERAKIRVGDVLQGIEPDPEIDVHEVRLSSGRGVFVKNTSDHETKSHCYFCPVLPHESVVVWFVPDREFVLRGDRLSEEMLIQVANAIR
jgi:hypothetical protein